MSATMTIGDFSRATRLSAKALRFYHEVGLLEPSWVDPVNGYRVYASEQIADAQIIRRFRSLDMPVDLIREVITAPGVTERNALIAAHLATMESQLQQTLSAVTALRGLLLPPTSTLDVEFRSVPPTPALVISETIDLADLSDWYVAATDELAEAVEGAEPIGPRGGVWETALFLHERGTATLFRPIRSLTDRPDPIGRARPELLPAVDLAVATHRGTDDAIGEVYAALGEYVTTHALSVDGPIRETYLEEPDEEGYAVTEIGWPIFRTVGG